MAFVKVHVWMPKGGFHYFIGNGHGSVEILTHDRDFYYVTWLSPSDKLGVVLKQNVGAASALGFRTVKNANGQEVRNPDRYRDGGVYLAHTFDDDCAARDHQQPNFSYEVPVLPRRLSGNPASLTFGVSIPRMVQFWKKLLSLPPGHPARRYAMLSTRNNCNGVVVDALLEGGLGIYAPPPDNFIYQDGRTLARWVEKAVERINGMNLAHRKLAEEITGDRWTNPGIAPDHSIPTREEWRKESDKGIAFYARRKEQVEQIDTYLRCYHRAVGEQNLRAEINSLLMIQWHAYDHLARKPKSDRRQAILGLAKRVLAALEYLHEQYDQAPVDTNFEQPPDVARLGAGLTE